MTEVASRILSCYTPFDPKSFFPGIRGPVEQDDRSLDLKEIDWTKVDFRNFLDAKTEEQKIIGEENLRRQIIAEHIRFGGNVFLSLWNDYRMNHEDSVLEWLFTHSQVTLVVLPGLVLLTQNGHRCVPYFDRRCVNWRDAVWTNSYLYLDIAWGSRFLSGVLET